MAIWDTPGGVNFGNVLGNDIRNIPNQANNLGNNVNNFAKSLGYRDDNNYGFISNLATEGNKSAINVGLANGYQLKTGVNGEQSLYNPAQDLSRVNPYSMPSNNPFPNQTKQQDSSLPQLPGLPQYQPMQNFQSGFSGQNTSYPSMNYNQGGFNGGQNALNNFFGSSGSNNSSSQQPSIFGGNFNGTAGQVQQGLNGIEKYNPIVNQDAFNQRQIQNDNFNKLNGDYRGQHLNDLKNATNLGDFFSAAIQGHQDRSDMARSTDLLKQNNGLAASNIENINNTKLQDITDQRKSELGLGGIQNQGNEINNSRENNLMNNQLGTNRLNLESNQDNFNNQNTAYNQQMDRFNNGQIMQMKNQYNNSILNPKQYTQEQLNNSLSDEEKAFYTQKFGSNYMNNPDLVNSLQSKLQQNDASKYGMGLMNMQNPGYANSINNPNIDYSYDSSNGSYKIDAKNTNLRNLSSVNSLANSIQQNQDMANKKGVPITSTGTSIMK